MTHSSLHSHSASQSASASASTVPVFTIPADPPPSSPSSPQYIDVHRRTLPSGNSTPATPLAGVGEDTRLLSSPPSTPATHRNTSQSQSRQPASGSRTTPRKLSKARVPSSSSSTPSSTFGNGFSAAGGLGDTHTPGHGLERTRPTPTGLTPPPTLRGSGSMILYRLATPEDRLALAAADRARAASVASASGSSNGHLTPPRPFNRDSVGSSSGSSMLSFGDHPGLGSPGHGLGHGSPLLGPGPGSPSPSPGTPLGSIRSLSISLRGSGQGLFIPYAYDPFADDGPHAVRNTEKPTGLDKEELDDSDMDMDPEDLLHTPHRTPASRAYFAARSRAHHTWFGPYWRGLLNIGVLVFLVGGLVCLFAVYPVVSWWMRGGRFGGVGFGNGDGDGGGTFLIPFFWFGLVFNYIIDDNDGGTEGGYPKPPPLPIPSMIDIYTPAEAKTRKGFDGQAYELVFSDEFEVDGRSFYKGAFGSF